MKPLYFNLTRFVAGGLLTLAGCGAPVAQGTAAPVKAAAEAARAENETANAESAEGKKAPRPADSTSQLDRALALARRSLATLEDVPDYTCVFSKRERVGDELLPEERNKMKVRQQPFSVYLRVIEPTTSAGQEVIYVEGRNNGNLIAHTTGFGSSVIGRLSLDPHGYLATRGNRYTIKDVGLANLVKKLIELGGKKELFRESTTTIEKTEFAERPCTQVEISSPRPVGDFRLAIARIVLDDEWDVPVHFESHEWPQDGTQPLLTETYTYFELKLNAGLTDHDFDPDNPEYSFP